MFDIIIKNGTVINGRQEPVRADVGINGDSITDTGDVGADARLVLDAAGLVVAPGFIDMHSHNDFVVTRHDPVLSKLTQGVTTEVIGNCGFSGAPYTKDSLPFFNEYVFPILGEKDDGAHWFTWENYLSRLHDSPLVCNMAPLVGQGNLRAVCVGIEDREASPAERETMQKLLTEIMRCGCWGLSTGLIYPPGMFTPEAELVELARVAGEAGGIYTTHIRGESYNVVESVQESLMLGRKSGVPVHISHLKVAGRNNWHKTGELLDLIADAGSQGVHASFDVYPYKAGSTSLTAILPPWSHEGGVAKMLARLRDRETRKRMRHDILNGIPGWQNFAMQCSWDDIIVSQVRSGPDDVVEGKSLRVIAEQRGRDPVECVFDIVVEENSSVSMIIFLMGEESVREIMSHERGLVGTDGLPSRRPHPRTWGTFPRVFAKYVREEPLVAVEEAVYKCSTGPARKLGLAGRGEIKAGYKADIVVFDTATIQDQATYEEPTRAATGIRWVIVNGEPAIADGAFTGKTAGTLLLKT